MACEPICWGFEHAPFNGAAIETMRAAFRDAAVSFYGEAGHIDFLKGQLGPAAQRSVEWNSILIPLRHSQMGARFKDDFDLVKRLLRRAEGSNSTVALLSANQTILLSLKLLLLSRHRGRRIQVFLHGGLASLNGPQSRNPFNKARHIRFALSLPPHKNLQYIVMEETIREALLDIMPAIGRKVAVLDHPVPPGEGADAVVDCAPPLRFGFLGLATEAKGFSTFLTAAERVTAKSPGGAEFHAIGMYSQERQRKEIERRSLATRPSLVPLDRKRFRKAVSELHFICLPYAKGHYDLSPSGVLLDAIAWEKPVIAINTPLLEQLFSRFGPMGRLCPDKEEFCEAVEAVARRFNESEYREWTAAMHRVKQTRQPAFLAHKYRLLYNQLFGQISNAESLT